jgi:hypothetical protein
MRATMAGAAWWRSQATCMHDRHVDRNDAVRDGDMDDGRLGEFRPDVACRQHGRIGFLHE